MIKIDQRLRDDSIVLGYSSDTCLLLMNNRLFPWFILVPDTDTTEFYQLEEVFQHSLVRQINALSEFISAEFHTDKLNIATIGNIVSQLHIHIIGRTTTDLCWPGVVWGTRHKQAYSSDECVHIKKLVETRLGDHYRL
jgi:diadenosine tetraphosphate (Ap4A) HIT family hydrolase